MTDDSGELTTYLGQRESVGHGARGGCQTPGCYEFSRFNVEG